MLTHVKICRDCGEEYRPQALRCTDCGGELEERQLDDDGTLFDPEPVGEAEAAAQAEGAPQAEAAGRVLFVTPRANELVPLAEALRAEGLAYHLLERPAHREGAAPSYALVVPEDVAAAALRTLAPLVAPGHDAAEVEGIEARFEPERGYVRCPACAAEQPPGAAECGECGLTLGTLEEEELAACPRCGAPLPSADTPCSACGSTRVG
jgi:ribosomal protein L40E